MSFQSNSFRWTYCTYMFDKKLSQQIRLTHTFLQLTKEITAQCPKHNTVRHTDILKMNKHTNLNGQRQISDPLLVPVINLMNIPEYNFILSLQILRHPNSVHCSHITLEKDRTTYRLTITFLNFNNALLRRWSNLCMYLLFTIYVFTYFMYILCELI